MRVQPYQFAQRYTARELQASPERRAAFVRDYLTQEAEFFQVARDPVSGLARDGVQLSEQTGQMTGVRGWSAPSKECLDLGLLIKALGGDERVVSQARAVEILTQKLDTYEDFARRKPGFGGFLPWYTVDRKLEPTRDWSREIPGLDNGEWLWTMLTAEKALKDSGHTELAARYAAYNEKLQNNATRVFYDRPAGKIRGDVVIDNPDDPNTGYRTNTSPNRSRHLTGVHGMHEGSMLLLYVTLFGKGLSERESDRVWDGVGMRRVEHRAGTTWQGWWGSSHESWAFMFLPLRDMEGYQKLFRVREVIRSQNAVERHYPGLASSTNDPNSTGYLDGAGIEGINEQPIRNNHTFALYGAFPMLMAAPAAGVIWLHNMLLAPHQQGPLGGGESGTNDGRAASHVKTVDGSFPNVLALQGGLERETAAMLREKGAYDKFRRIMQREFDEVFSGRPLREPVGLALPNTQVPQGYLKPYGRR